ncbi:hypothetical protein DIPPA_27016 [Diplonema papillatum]|nr:hypothetical protein DIPPA_27016 [Diplonema papillatum]
MQKLHGDPQDARVLLRCRKPVLVVHGTDDAATPVDQAVALVASADLLLLKGVAHGLPDSHAGVVAAAIVRGPGHLHLLPVVAC